MTRIISVIILMVTLYISAVLTLRKEKNIFQEPNYTPVDVSNIDFGQLVYVPVHAKLYPRAGAKTLYLNTALKIRNISFEDSIYVSMIEHFDADGKVLRKYLDSAILIKPMATFEIVSKAAEYEGKGDHFIVEWHSHNANLKPVIESISYDALNCLVFTNEGKVVKDTKTTIKDRTE